MKSRDPIARRHWLYRWFIGTPILVCVLVPWGILDAIWRAAKAAWQELAGASLWRIFVPAVIAIVFGDYESPQEARSAFIKRMRNRSE